jgi:cytochrome c peroxidase
MRRANGLIIVLAVLGTAGAPWHGVLAQLPPVPVPVENPVTEAKRVLGKILFWDEQLSSDGTVACGTCHQPAAGGADPRVGHHRGTSESIGDDVWGSPGIAAATSKGEALEHALFGRNPQVTPRTAPSNFGGLWAAEQFWDGRAGSTFVDPVTGQVAIASGGSLESQALAPMFNPVEMAWPERTWDDLTDALEAARPLALATNLPPDVAAAIAADPSYPALFAAAFDDPAITPVRIAFAIATYERTLVADRTPWDRYVAGDESALSERAARGWRAFQQLHCVNCHEPPLFTNNDFFNIGLRRIEIDPGRQLVTGIDEDGGDMKVPSLRNVALRQRFMHTGEFGRLGDAILFYDNGNALPGRDDIPDVGIYLFRVAGNTRYDLAAFFKEGLVDPRVASESYPFDRPTLRSEMQQ